ncbi:hypothetical protein NDU88_006065 [Pleurodeles waltl]|uniref:Uncharacterized protein n=1 Tax=Pleurodeles waltl TaxID=8319 RepID=A0AAV7TCD6_PLEWA|nr:hypothetical protein NDU88_006065 [Pleurodeles waltl]
MTEFGCEEADPEVGTKLRQILVALQGSLAKMDGKIDALSFHMDRMSERLDKHSERLDMVVRCVSDVEDEEVTASAAHRTTSVPGFHSAGPGGWAVIARQNLD